MARGGDYDAGDGAKDMNRRIWLRHTAATAIRKQFGLEAAQLVLGHSSAAITDAVYAERDRAQVEDVISKIG